MGELIKTLRIYIAAYQEPPYGREVQGTQELLEKAAINIQRSIELLEQAAEELENCYGRETELTEKIRKQIN